MPTMIAQLGAQAASQAISTGMGLLMEKHNDKRQIEQQRKLNDLEMVGQKHMTDYNMGKQLQMWKDTNYGPQMEEMRKAGLNPGMMYGMSGGGATTVGQANGNVEGGKAPAGGGEVMGQQMLGLERLAQVKLLDAQRRNLDADTADKQANIPVKETTVPNIKANTKNTETNTAGKELENKYNKDTMNDRVDLINTQAAQAIAELDITNDTKTISHETRIARREQILSNAAGEILRNALTKAQTANTVQKTQESVAAIRQMDRQAAQWMAQISQGWHNLTRQDIETGIKALETKWKMEHPGLGQVIGGTIEGIKKLLEKPELNPIKATINEAQKQR